MEDMEEAMKLMPGTAKLNIHASYAIFEDVYKRQQHGD